jgi:hypothetical protein
VPPSTKPQTSRRTFLRLRIQSEPTLTKEDAELKQGKTLGCEFVFSIEGTLGFALSVSKEKRV